MTTQMVDVALIDVVSAYCALNNVKAATLMPLTFGEVVQRLGVITDKHGAWVTASREIRHQYPICHEECHIERIQMVMADVEGQKAANSEPAQIIPFPTNHTKH